MRMFLAGVGVCLGLLASACAVVQQKPPADPAAVAAPAGVRPVQINIVPAADGVRARYALPGVAKIFALRDNASDIRTDTWSTPTPGAHLERNHVALGDGLRVFEIDLKPDTQQRDRIYPALSAIGDGWLIYAPQLLPPETSGQPYEVSYNLPDGWVLLGPTDKDDKLTLDGWIFVGPSRLVESGATNVAVAPSTPAWLHKEILSAANTAAAFFEKRLDVKLDSAPAIIISVYPDDASNSVRGDVTPGSMMSVRFYGNAWLKENPASANQVRELLAHEIFHFWNGGIADSADDARFPWLHEGGASYAALLVLNSSAKPEDPSFVAKLNQNLGECQSALGESETLKTASKLQFGTAPYACGVVLQWAWDAGLRSYSTGGRDVLWQWKAMIADARGKNGKYSLDDAVRLTPSAAAGAANILLNQSGPDRWAAFANAMRGYGAQMTEGRNPDEDRAAALMHVLGQHCKGQRGFTTFDTHIALDTGDRCGPLNGDKDFDAVAGFNVFTDASALYDRVQSICASGGAVEFIRNGVVVASAPCTSPLPAPATFLRITRAFGG